MEYQQEYEDERDWEVTQDLIDLYKTEEQRLAQMKVTGNCWILSEAPWDVDGAEYDDCHFVETPPPTDPLRWPRTCLFPIIREIAESRHKSKDEQLTYYGKKLGLE